MAGQGTGAKVQPQAAPGALGRGLTALEIQRFILGQTKILHEGKQSAQLQVVLARDGLGAQQKSSEMDADSPLTNIFCLHSRRGESF